MRTGGRAVRLVFVSLLISFIHARSFPGEICLDQRDF